MMAPPSRVEELPAAAEAGLTAVPSVEKGPAVVVEPKPSARLVEELHASEQRFHQLVDAVTDYAIFMLDATGHVATWNVGAQKNKGYEPHEILGRPFSVFYTAEDRAAGKPQVVLDTVRQ